MKEHFWSACNMNLQVLVTFIGVWMGTWEHFLGPVSRQDVQRHLIFVLFRLERALFLFPRPYAYFHGKSLGAHPSRQHCKLLAGTQLWNQESRICCRAYLARILDTFSLQLGFTAWSVFRFFMLPVCAQGTSSPFFQKKLCTPLAT